MEILYGIIGLAIGFILAWLIRKPAPGNEAGLPARIGALEEKLAAANIRNAESGTRLDLLGETLKSRKTELDELAQRAVMAEHELRRSGEQLHVAQTELRFKDQQLLTQQGELAKIGGEFTRQFEDLARKVLEEKTERFAKQQEKSLADILTPLRENIQTFKTEFETRYSTESADRISLREQIRHMLELNSTLSTQANNLTNALRGQVKHQGNWGEMILESILEYADLKKDLHYFVQEHTHGEDGQSLYPDIVVRYPDDRSIVIDSKVSLLHFEQYTAATDADAQALSLRSMIASVYAHIDGLSAKKYQEAVGSLDFVLLFVPVEGAYITMMQAERDLWQYAYKKRVLLISPTNLIAAMKLVYDMWKRDNINQNAQEIAEKAVKIYEKLAAFLEDFEKVGAQLEKAAGTYQEASKKLYKGKGNLIRQASQMKDKISHNKPIRNLPLHMEEESAEEEEQTGITGVTDPEKD